MNGCFVHQRQGVRKGLAAFSSKSTKFGRRPWADGLSIRRNAGLDREGGLSRDQRDNPPSASREFRLPQDLGHRRLSGPPPGSGDERWRNHDRRGCPRTAGARPHFRGISGPETAFVVQHDRANARAAHRRPGAEHRARPVLPDATSGTDPCRTIDFYKKSRTTARAWRFLAGLSVADRGSSRRFAVTGHISQGRHLRSPVPVTTWRPRRERVVSATRILADDERSGPIVFRSDKLSMDPGSRWKRSHKNLYYYYAATLQILERSDGGSGRLAAGSLELDRR